MEITLEKIELVKDRTGVTYAEAKQALEENDGSVVDAIIDIEETVNAGKKERSFGERGQSLFKKLKELFWALPSHRSHLSSRSLQPLDSNAPSKSSRPTERSSMSAMRSLIQSAT